MLFFLPVLYAAVSAAPVPQICGQTIEVTTTYVLPVTQLGPNANCTITVSFPPDLISNVVIAALNLDLKDNFKITDTYGDIFEFDKKLPFFNHDSIWPSNFTLEINTAAGSNANIKMNIELYKMNVNNVESSQSTGLKEYAPVYYFWDLKDGASYEVTSDHSKLALRFTSEMLDEDEKNNILIYDGEKPFGTLRKVDNNHLSQTNKLTLYVAKRFSSRGALIVNDYSNIQFLNQYYAKYAPVYAPKHTVTSVITGGKDVEAAFTVIGDKDGSTPIDVLKVENLDEEDGTFTYSVGGPQGTRKYTFNELPKRLPGNTVTFYISSGQGSVKHFTQGI